MIVPNDVRSLVDQKINQCIAVVEQQYGRKFDFPTIIYTKKGTVAGTASDHLYRINLNPVLLTENVDAFIARTVPHEFAHLVDGIVNPHTRQGRKRSIHGPSWKAIMELLGAESSRTHSYDVTGVRRRKSSSHLWECKCGDSTITLGKVRHRRQIADHIRGFIPRYFARGHVKCGGYAPASHVYPTLLSMEA